LTIYSVTPPKQYDACPYCFANLEPEPQIDQNDAPEQLVEQNVAPEPILEQEETMETAEEYEETADYQSENIVLEKVKDSGPRFFKKFKALIPGSSGLKKEKKQQTEEPEAELEDEPEPAVKEKVSNDKPKTEPAVKETEQKPAPSASKEDLTSGCPATFGYLANRPKDEPIQQVCLVCPKMVDCMLSPRED